MVIYPKSAFGDDLDGKYEFVQKMAKLYPDEVIKVLPSESKDMDTLHGLGYGKEMTIKYAVEVKAYFIRFGCGCGFELVDPSKSFVSFLTSAGLLGYHRAPTETQIDIAKAESTNDSGLPDREDFDKTINEGMFSRSGVFDEDTEQITTSDGISFEIKKGAGEGAIKQASKSAYNEFRLLGYAMSAEKKEFMRKFFVDSERQAIVLRLTSTSVKNGKAIRQGIVELGEDGLIYVEKEYRAAATSSGMEYVGVWRTPVSEGGLVSGGSLAGETLKKLTKYQKSELNYKTLLKSSKG